MKIYDVVPIHVFRYKVTELFEDEQTTEQRSGYVAGFSYADAVARLETINTPPSKEFEDCCLISIDSLYEVEAFDVGVLSDDDIKDIFNIEKKEG